MAVDSYRARARRRKPANLQLQSIIPFQAVATITPAGAALTLQSDIAMSNVATVTPSATLQLDSLIPFTATAEVVAEPEELHLAALVDMANTASVLPSATLQLDSQVAMTNSATVVPSATLQLDSLIPYTLTAELHEQSVELALASLVSMANTARLAASIKAAANIAMTNTAQLRSTLALRTTVTMTNTAQLSTPAGPNVTFVPLSINHSGTQDVTAALQAVIDGAPNGDEIRFPITNPRATYRIDGTLDVHSRNNLEFNGNGCLFVQNVVGGRERSFWDCLLSANCTWYGFTMRGHNYPNSLGNGNSGGGAGDTAFNAAYEAQHGWNIVSCRNISLFLNTVTDIWGDFTYLANGSGGAAVILTSGRINNNTFARNGRQACSMQGVDGIEYDHNNVQDVRRAMFDFEPNNIGQFILNVDIHHNTFGLHRLLFIAASGGLPACPISNIDVHDNRGTGNYSVELFGETLVDACTVPGDPFPPHTYNHGAAGVGATLTANANGVFPLVDGIVIGLNRQIVVASGTFAYANGVYTLTDRGSTTTPWVLTRSVSADTKAELAATDRFVRSGMTRAHTGWHAPTGTMLAPGFTYGTDGIFWQQIASTDNTLPALVRGNFRFVNNTTTFAYGTTPAYLMVLQNLDGVTITGNVHPMQPGRNMVFARLVGCSNYVVSGNTGSNLAGQLSSNTTNAGQRAIQNPLYGLTFDSDAGAGPSKLYPQEVALTTLPHMPTLRFVADPGEAPSRYSAIVNRYLPYSYLMAMPADSTAFKNYTLLADTPAKRDAAIAAYKARFETYLDTFEDSVDLWEAGNELGGKWLFDNSLGQFVGQQLVADMTLAAHNSIKARGKRSVVTLWENDWGTNNCGDGTNMEMNPATFSLRLPATMRHDVDYLLISWYPTQCTANGNPINPIVPTATIKASVQALHLLYPNAWIGFGELGLPAKVTAGTLASAKSIANYYYNLDLDLPYFVGGYFWWYGQQDAVPASTSLMFDTLQTAMGPPPRLEFPIGFAPGAGLPVKVGTTYPELDAMRQFGAKFVRLTYGWDAADPTHNGSFVANNAIKDVIAYCNFVGLDVILTFGFSGTAPYQNHIYSYIPQYAASAVGCATFFDGTPGRKLLACELGNEPNHAKADSVVPANQKGAKYAEILIRVFDPLFGNIRAINPNLDVIIAGLGGEREVGNDVSSFQFTQDVHGPHTVMGQTITIGYLTHYDGWVSHPYSYYTLPSQDTQDGWDNLKNIMAWFQLTFGQTPPIWITEFGWPTDEHFNGTTNPLYLSDCHDAADALTDMARLLDMTGWDVRCLAWFSFMNNNKVPPGGHDNYFGILENAPDFTSPVPKPYLAARFSTVATRGPST